MRTTKKLRGQIMTDIKLSKRMKTFADMVDEERVADIGCDHAFVSMYLASLGKAKKVIAMDVKKGPLNIAKDNIKAYGMDKLIEVRMSDGFQNLLQEEVDCAIIAGMGGGLMVDILSRGRNHMEAGIHLVLQPQSEPWKVRQYLFDMGYVIIKEDFLLEEGKYYVVFKAIPSKENVPCYNQYELTYGRLLLCDKHPVLLQYIEQRRNKNIELFNKLQHIHTDKSFLRQDGLKKEIAFDEEVLKLMS